MPTPVTDPKLLAMLDGGQAPNVPVTTPGKPVNSPEMVKLLELSSAADAEAQRQSRENQLVVPQGGGRVEPMIRPKAESPNDTVFGTIGKMTEGAGRAVQSAVEPYIGGTGSDIAGAVTQEALNYVLPQAGSTGVRLAAKGLARLLPGAQGGKMERLIGKTGTQLEELLARGKRSEAGYQRAVNKIPAGDTAPLSNTMKAVEAIIADEKAHGIKDKALLKDAESLKAMIEANAGAPALSWIDNELTRVGEKTKAVKGVEANPAYKRLFGAMASDLESTKPQSLGTYTEFGKPSVRTVGEPASKSQIVTGRYTDRGAPTVRTVGAKEFTATTPSGPYGDSLTSRGAESQIIESGTPRQVDITQDVFLPSTQRTVADLGSPRQVERVATPSGRGTVIRARDEASRRRMGIETVIDEFNKMVKTKRGSNGAQDINANQLSDKLRKNEFLQDSLRPEDWKEVEPLLEKLADTAALPPPSGASYGSGRAMARGSVAGGLSYLFGGNPVTTAAAVTGIDYAVGHALMTKTGRKLIKGVLEMDGLERSQKLNLINATARLAFEGYNAATGKSKAKSLADLGLQ
jgi:hypothetical protein